MRLMINGYQECRFQNLLNYFKFKDLQSTEEYACTQEQVMIMGRCHCWDTGIQLYVHLPLFFVMVWNWRNLLETNGVYLIISREISESGIGAFLEKLAQYVFEYLNLENITRREIFYLFKIVKLIFSHAQCILMLQMLCIRFFNCHMHKRTFILFLMFFLTVLYPYPPVSPNSFGLG